MNAPTLVRVDHSPTAWRVHVEPSGVVFDCPQELTLLEGSEHLGRFALRAGCRGGGCGACLVRVERGNVRVKRMSKAHVDDDRRARGFVLACRAYPLSDLWIAVCDSKYPSSE